jgi:hypothetical protein
MAKVVWYSQGETVNLEDFKTKAPVKKDKPVILNSFHELGTYLGRTKRTKPVHPGILVSVTTFFDAHVILRNSTDVRLLKRKPNGKWNRTKVPRKTLNKYFQGNADGSTTITGRKAIEQHIIPVLTR